MTNRRLFVFGLWLVGATAGLAATITIDFNGFTSTMGGQVTGPGLDHPILMPWFAQTVVLDNLQAAQTYHVDFLHDDTIDGSSDFDFVVAADGKGVASVALGDGVYQGLDGFKPGDRTLKLRTFTIIYHANTGQPGGFLILGLIHPDMVGSAVLLDESGRWKLTMIPGEYRVDNLTSFGGLEDFAFAVNDQGKPVPVTLTRPETAPDTVAIRNSAEFAEFTDTEVKPRSVRVHYRIESNRPIPYAPSYLGTNVVANGNTAELDMLVAVGGAGLHFWTFGTNTVSGGTAVKPDGRPDLGTRREKGYPFYSMLRYDLTRKQFYFATTNGPSQTVTGEAEGLADDGVTPLQAKVTATIAAPPAK